MTHKQNFPGIVAGFCRDCVYVFFQHHVPHLDPNLASNQRVFRVRVCLASISWERGWGFGGGVILFVAWGGVVWAGFGVGGRDDKVMGGRS